jgi:hypothetical protein
MINENITSWILPFRSCDFESLTAAQFETGMEQAKDRALHTIKADPCGPIKGWGITQEILDSDSSGQLQKAVELLTIYEFLSTGVSDYAQAGQAGEYESATGERLKLSVDEAIFTSSRADKYRDKARAAAAGYIQACQTSNGSSGMLVRPYDFDNLNSYYANKQYGWRL